MFDVEKIVESCGFDKESSDKIIENIKALSDNYSSNELSDIYNYIIENVDDISIVSEVIKLSDYCKSPKTLSLLIDKLIQNKVNQNEDDITLKILCAKEISNYKDTSTVHAFLYCLNNKNENYKVRLACADALGRIGDKFAVIPLINIVKDEDEKSVYVKESAAFALGMLGDTCAIDPLVSIIEAKQGIFDKFSFLKEKIIEALGKLNINNAKVLRVLKTSLTDSSEMVRINSIEALMNSDYAEAQGLIRTCLRDESEEVQKNALIALYNISGRDILDEVISLPGYSNALKEEAQRIIDDYEDGEEE